MKRVLILAGAAWFAIALVASPAAAAPDDRAAMIAEARAALPEFLAAYRSGQFDRATFVIKYPLGGWEHIWVEIDAIENDVVVGRLSNVPAQPEYQQGQAVRVPLAEAIGPIATKRG